jgi:nicotinate-nucleotide pyrophosphorylase (carboxylating)
VTDLDFPFDDACRLVRTALDEDLGPRHLDVTTLATIPAGQVRSAEMVARAAGVVAGLPVVPLVFDEVASVVGTGGVDTALLVEDGSPVDRGDVVARVEGPLRTVLIAERTMLNIVSRLSGVATHTRRWAEVLDGTGAMVLDTRKTTPGMRQLEKYAVRAGGGTNKRMGLYDVAMIKDNHKLAAGSVSAAYELVRKRFPDVTVQVEVTTPAEAQEAYDAGARFIMCDNMSLELLRDTVALLRAQSEPVEIEPIVDIALDLVD